MFKNLPWKTALRRAIEVFLAALLGGAGMYLSLDDPSLPEKELSIMLASSIESLG